MSQLPVSVDNFGSLDLASDPLSLGMSGAVDLLNTDFDQRGRVRTRDGYANFTATAAASLYSGVFSYVSPAGRFLLAVKDADSLNAIDDTGTIVSTLATTDFDSSTNLTSCALFGAPATAAADEQTLAYIGNGLNSIRRWDGSAWTTPTATVGGSAGLAMPKGCPYLYPRSNRLAVTCFASGSHVLGPNGLQSSPSHVWFSDAGTLATPLAGESYPVNNFVELTPGDGQKIRGCASFQNEFYVFKEKRFFVFYGESKDTAGNPTFLYRVVEGVGMSGYSTASSGFQGVVTGADGVYFLNENGIWRTTGGAAVRVSVPLDPFFRGTASTFINRTRLRKVTMAWHNKRLWVGVPSGASTVNDRLLVFDPEVGWFMHDLPCAGLTSHMTSSLMSPNLFFSRSSGAKHIGQHGPGFTLDDVTAIGWSYTTGYSDVGGYFRGAQVKAAERKRLNGIDIYGSGTVTHQVLALNGRPADVADPGGSVTLGAAPVVARGRRTRAARGVYFAHKLSGSGVASVSRLTHYIATVGSDS